jgi:flagellar hook-length control protein FliK
MEMLNIPPAQPQTNPTTAPKGNANKGENKSFQNVMGKANQNAQKDQQKGVVNSTEDEGTELHGTVQLGDEATEHSQQVASAESDEQTTELLEEATDPVDFTMGAVPGLPIEQVPSTLKAEPSLKTDNQQIVAEGAKSSNLAQLPPEATLQSAKTDASTSIARVAPDVTSQKVSTENLASVTASQTASETTQTQAASTTIVTETLPTVEDNVADSTLPAGLAHRTASADSRQKMAIPENAASAITQVNPGKTSEQTDLVSNESRKKTGLMESSLGSLLQEVRPLRDQSRGRLNANLNRGETASIAISGQESSKIVAGTQNEDSHPSFASKQENGFSALQSDAATNGANSVINATPFETALESGMHGSLTAQQGNQPLQAASVEPGSIRLASGEFVSENQIVNQVMDRIAVERAGNQSRIVIRMNPEELGEVKLALTMEKDQLRAQLLTQNQQVQEILEKHLPKLHEALSQQGVKLEDIQVGVDSNRHSGQEAFANHRQPDSFRRHFNAPAGISNNDPVHPAIASTRSASTEGLSLRI